MIGLLRTGMRELRAVGAEIALPLAAIFAAGFVTAAMLLWSFPDLFFWPLGPFSLSWAGFDVPSFTEQHASLIRIDHRAIFLAAAEVVVISAVLRRGGTVSAPFPSRLRAWAMLAALYLVFEYCVWLVRTAVGLYLTWHHGVVREITPFLNVAFYLFHYSFLATWILWARIWSAGPAIVARGRPDPDRIWQEARPLFGPMAALYFGAALFPTLLIHGLVLWEIADVRIEYGSPSDVVTTPLVLWSLGGAALDFGLSILLAATIAAAYRDEVLRAPPA